MANQPASRRNRPQLQRGDTMITARRVAVPGKIRPGVDQERRVSVAVRHPTAQHHTSGLHRDPRHRCGALPTGGVDPRKDKGPQGSRRGAWFENSLGADQIPPWCQEGHLPCLRKHKTLLRLVSGAEDSRRPYF